VAEGYKSLKEGARVTFELNDGAKGLMAANIQPEATPLSNNTPSSDAPADAAAS
jgi:CspA family cold shock protein